MSLCPEEHEVPASLCPEELEVPALDLAIAMKRPVGMLYVKVIKAMNLKKKHLWGSFDPYAKLKLTNDKRLSKKTDVKHKNLNPEWYQDFTLRVEDPQVQALEVMVKPYGIHDIMGMNLVPLKDLTPEEPKTLTLDLLKNMDPNDTQNQKSRGQIVVAVLYKPLGEEGDMSYHEEEVSARLILKAHVGAPEGRGLLFVAIIEGENLEGTHHTNPSVCLVFQGKERRTKPINKNRNPRWDEEFTFTLEEPPTNEKMHLEVVTTSNMIGLIHPKESLGYIDINLSDVVENIRIKEKYHLIDSKNGRLLVEIQRRAWG